MPTLRDVAKAANVSIGTASRVLNGKGDEVGIAKQTQARVLRAARQLNYIPNRNARNLRLRRGSDTVCFLTGGLFTRIIISPFFSPVIHALETHAAQAGLRLTYARIDIDRLGSDSKHPNLSDILSSDVKAIVTIGRLPSQLLEYITSANLLLVGIEPYSELVRRAVYVDNYGGIKQAVDHLIEVGCKRLALVLPVTSDGDVHPPFQERADAFLWLTAEKENGLEQAICHRVPSKHTDDTEAAFNGIQRFLLEQSADGLVCVSDLWAAETLRAARTLGLRVPHDLSVVGFDNLYWTKYTNPPLTTVEIPVDAMAEAVVRLLLEGANHGKPRLVRIKTGLVVRQTTLSRLEPTHF